VLYAEVTKGVGKGRWRPCGQNYKRKKSKNSAIKRISTSHKKKLLQEGNEAREGCRGWEKLLPYRGGPHGGIVSQNEKRNTREEVPTSRININETRSSDGLKSLD